MVGQARTLPLDALLQVPFPRVLSAHFDTQELLEPGTSGSLYGLHWMEMTSSVILPALTLAVLQVSLSLLGPPLFP